MVVLHIFLHFAIRSLVTLATTHKLLFSHILFLRAFVTVLGFLLEWPLLQVMRYVIISRVWTTKLHFTVFFFQSLWRLSWLLRLFISSSLLLASSLSPCPRMFGRHNTKLLLRVAG